MSSYSILCSSIANKNLKEIYYRKIRVKAVAGIDRINSSKFDDILEEEVNTIIRKVLKGNYKFTRYKELLISKGKDKEPRVISIPTIRDRIVLSALNDCLNSIYEKDNCSKLPHVIINEIKDAVNNNSYDYFIKYDVKNFYPSINQDILMKKIRRKIRNEQFLKLIIEAITTGTVSINGVKSNQKNEKGVPQGLSISNSLANVYLNSLDKKMKDYPNIKYYRYVDDILILCNSAEKNNIDNLIKKEIKTKLKLRLNEKCDEGFINEEIFEYLGYKFNKDELTVRNSSKYKIENSIETLLSKYNSYEDKDKNEELLKWKLNLKISGCIYNSKKYGWMFFYSQIEDKKLLTHLDWLVCKLLNRYKIDIKPKKFKRTYYEIRKCVHDTNYIINFDKYSIEQKKDVLYRIYKRKTNGYTSQQIDDLFKKLLFKDISSLEEDVQHFS